MKKLLVVFAIICLLVSSCTWYQSRPSVCDNLSEKSLLCMLAAKTGIKLEDMGTGLIIVNSILIAEGKYTQEQALEVVTTLRDILKKPVTYLYFYANVKDYLEKFPGLMLVDLDLLDELANSQVMHNPDRELLLNWLNTVIGDLG